MRDHARAPRRPTGRLVDEVDSIRGFARSLDSYRKAIEAAAAKRKAGSIMPGT
jgi:hypothetical protein